MGLFVLSLSPFLSLPITGGVGGGLFFFYGPKRVFDGRFTTLVLGILFSPHHGGDDQRSERVSFPLVTGRGNQPRPAYI